MTENTTTKADADDQRASRLDVRLAAAKPLRVAATVVRVLTLLFAALLVVHVVLTVAGATPTHPVTTFFRDRASGLSLGMNGLFAPADPTLGLVFNLGVAAVLWIVIGVVIAKLLRLAASALD